MDSIRREAFMLKITEQGITGIHLPIRKVDAEKEIGFLEDLLKKN